ncbi:5'-methylthioadenosine/S-adenosylhomocysteine nucleosidase [Companilactobacillus sp. RD055328]|uniref:5'-methylthioadenosine/adenosylhomocysteine nucleosidase n=1 Tax=Companilactobacillus sp. RD055328 TaxID=2916634 RepID=UPI001FC83F71|nr:5'-methylthioadenosine/adenosylhomocysteine nucleosidase [Companilactobacillus sp. RD055328]GKQ42837.1 5'-methylthioadenosine/S-adenosylhomocysteine nucleosidase [Companilactobacillus sp. RD055328]
MNLGVIIPMEEEQRLLLESMENIEESNIAGVTFYQGTYKKHHLVLALSGIGKVQASMTTTLMANIYQPELIINTGSAGGIGQGLKIGDVVISTKLAYHDVNVVGYKHGQLPKRELFFEADSNSVEKIASAATATGLAFHKGLIVTGDQFIGTNEQNQQILGNFPDALASEMEGAAVAQVCNEFKIPFVVIRSMSDVGDSNAAVDFDEFVVTAGKNSVSMLLNFLNNN